MIQPTVIATPSPTMTQRPGGSGGHGGNDNGKDTLQNWSSLIGIVTAIVGNMLIALALNVQRYAHTRLQKERVRVRQKARAALKRSSQRRADGTTIYGTVGNDANGNSNGSGHNPGSENDNENGRISLDNHETNPLAASFQPDSINASEDVADEDKVSSTYLKSPYWWLGQILITLGEMGNFLAYGFAPASIVSPLGVVALVSNCIIAPVMFHEKFRQRDFWGVVIAVAGVVTVVLSANQEETKLNPHDILKAITTLEFEIYLAVTILLIIILMWASRRYGRRTILIDLGLVGLFGGYTVLATKGVSSMLSSTLWRAFTTPVTYVLILILLATAIMQIRYVNKALQRFDSTQVIPIQFVLFTLSVILGSAILYGDFEKTTMEQAGKFIGGCLLTFFGVFLITTGRQHKDMDDDLLSEADGVEETIGLAQHEGHPSSPISESSTPNPQSRRSSRLSKVSFAETLRPTSPQRNVEIPDVRYSQVLSTTGSLERESTPLLRNPWQGSGDPSTPRSGFVAQPAESDKTTLGSEQTLRRPRPTTPLRDSQVPPTYPSGQPSTPRPGFGLTKSGSHNRPRTFISPSPLSSTVTSVVKDAFLRENDTESPRRSSMRRIRSSIRASLFFNDDEEDEDLPQQAVAAVSEDHLPRIFDGQEADVIPEDPARTRARSLSDTLGDFFRPKNKPKKSDSLDNDIEAGTAGAVSEQSHNTQA